MLLQSCYIGRSFDMYQWLHKLRNYCCCNLDLAVTIVKNRSGHLKDSEKNENNILLKTRFKRKNQLFIIDQQFL